MEVTKNNFKETLPLVEKSIKAADFLVIDCEFTGLLNGRDPTIFDTPSEYYSRLLAGSAEFMLVQFGLCAFHWDVDKKTYMNEAYNFYLFPQGRPGPERIFQCSSSSLCFLSAQGFDFNKLIKDGISYMSEPIETRMRDNLIGKQKFTSQQKDCIIIPEENKKYIEDVCKQVREFVDDKKQNELEIDKCNAFQRRLLFQELSTRFKNEIFLETKVLDNKNRVLKVTRLLTDNDEQERERLRKEREWEEFEDAVGFTKVARMISQSEKLVIGHNMVLDIIHTLSHFFQSLPTQYENFKEFAHFIFPRLLDTKYMSNLPPFKDRVNSSVLPHLLATLSSAPFEIPKSDSLVGRGYSQTDGNFHEAGYDAYITGLCFLSMYTHLLEMRGESNRVVAPDSAILKPFINKLFLARTAFQDSPYMYLSGQEPVPPRDHVFYLTFPKDWARTDISQLFSPFGPIVVQFLDDTSAFVALSRREGARDIMKVLGKSTTYTIIPFMNYKMSLLRSQEKVPAIPERIMSPPVPLRGKHTSEWASPYSKARKGGGDLVTPTKIERRRSISSSGVALKSSRKRTSSGVFLVESEPPAKKPETEVIDGLRTYSEVAKVRASVGDCKTKANGRRASKKSSDKKCRVPVKKVIESFEKSDGVNGCVNAFQESDSWD